MSRKYRLRHTDYMDEPECIDFRVTVSRSQETEGDFRVVGIRPQETGALKAIASERVPEGLSVAMNAPTRTS
ncbi:hypothetical protein Tco_1192503 [Tanacetum coccineum]